MTEENNSEVNSLNVCCPFPLVISPVEVRLTAMVKDWAKQFELILSEEDEDWFHKERLILIATRGCPQANENRLYLLAIAIYWITRYDDYCEDSEETGNLNYLQEMFDKYAKWILDLPEISETFTPLEASFVDLMSQSKALTNDVWVQRIQSEWVEWSKTVYRERQLKNERLKPSLKEYTESQYLTGAGGFMLDFVQMASNIFLPMVALTDESIEAIRLCYAKQLRFINDIYSYDKEKQSGSGNNLVAVLIDLNLSKEKAVKRAIEMFNREIEHFVELEKAVTKFDNKTNEDVKTILDVLKTAIRGHLSYVQQSKRYEADRFT